MHDVLCRHICIANRPASNSHSACHPQFCNQLFRTQVSIRTLQIFSRSQYILSGLSRFLVNLVPHQVIQRGHVSSFSGSISSTVSADPILAPFTNSFSSCRGLLCCNVVFVTGTFTFFLDSPIGATQVLHLSLLFLRLCAPRLAALIVPLIPPVARLRWYLFFNLFCRA